MKLSLLIAASTAACSHGFVVLETTKTGAYAQSASSLGQQMNGFLNEKKNSLNVGDVDTGGWNPFGKQKAKLEPKKEAAKIQKKVVEAVPKQERVKEEAAKIQKKVVEAVPKQEHVKEALKKASDGFKFPWDK